MVAQMMTNCSGYFQILVFITKWSSSINNFILWSAFAICM